MIYSVSHSTEYLYDNYVNYCHNLAILKPRETPEQQILEYDIDIKPVTNEISERTDFFGNNVTRFSIQYPHNKLCVTTRAKISRNYIPYKNDLFSASFKKITLLEAINELQKTDNEILDARQFILESPNIRKISNEIKEYSAISFQPNRPIFNSAFELMGRIHSDFQFLPGYTNISTPINNVFLDKKGVCQDFAQVAIACIRSVGLPARYISGYINTYSPNGKEKLAGADASHAWLSMYIPDFGWIDFDPTNNQIAENQHIVLAWGRDYYDVPPLKGVIYSNGKHEMKVAVDIKQL
jgi:transglutaminase-like putative cysteine protease